MKKTAITISLMLLGNQALAKDCTFRFVEEGPKFQWTAYKFTEKTPVKGSFREVRVRFGKKSAKSVTELLSSANLEIEGSSIETGDTARNQNIAANFFEKMSKKGVIRGSVSAKGTDQSGDLKFNLLLNGTRHVLTAPYHVDDAGVFKAVGFMDLLQIGLKGPFESLQKACEGLHTGKDGKSRTWSTVDYVVEGKIEKECG